MRTYYITCGKDKLCWLSSLGTLKKITEIDMSTDVYVEFESFHQIGEIANALGDSVIDGVRFIVT